MANASVPTSAVDWGDFRGLFDHTHDAVFIDDLNGRIRAANHQATVLTGRPLDQIIGAGVADFCVPEEAEAAVERYRTLLAGEPLPLYERTYERPDGTRVPGEVNAALITDDEGNPLYVQAVVRDISARKRAESGLDSLLVSAAAAVGEDFFRKAAEELATRFGLAGALFTERRDDGRLHVLGWWGRSFTPGQTTFDPAPEPCATVLESDGPVIVSLEDYPSSIFTENGYTHYLGFPLQAGDRAIGTIGVFHDRPIEPNDVISRVLRILAGRGAAEVERLRADRQTRTIQASLEATDSRLKEAQELARLGYWEWTISSGDLWWSEQTRLIFGVDPSATASYDLWASRIHETDRSAVEQAVHQALEHGEVFDLHHRVVRSESDVRIVHCLGRVTRDQAGEPVRFFGTIMDITDRAAAERALRDSRARLQEAQRLARIAHWESDIQGRCTAYDDVLCELTGYPPDEILGIGPDELESPTVKGSSRAAFLEVLATGNPNPAFSWELVTKTGERRFVQSSISLRRDADGNPVGFLGLVRDVTDERTGQIRLQESENRYRSLFELSPHAIAVHRNGIIMFVNRACAEMVGFDSPAEMEGLATTDFIHPDYQDFVRARLKRLMVTGRPLPPAEQRFLRRDGTPVDVQVRGHLLELADGPAVQSVIEDISARKKAEQQREFMLSQLVATFEATDEGMVVIDSDGELVNWNRRFCEMMRLPRDVREERDTDQAMRLIEEQLVNPADLSRWDAPLAEDPERSTYDELRFKDGRLFERFSLPQLIAGLVVGRVWSYRDMTDRHQAEAALRASERRYRTLVERATLGIYRSTPEGRFTAVNPALVEMLGYESPEEVLALDLARSVYVDPGVRNGIVEQFVDADRIENLDVEWRCRNGDVIDVRLNGRVVRQRNGEIECYEMLAEDVTLRRAWQAQLAQAQKLEAVGQLAVGVAHDFNNLLAVIQGSADLLRLTVDGTNPKQHKHLTAIAEAVRKGRGIIDKLTGFSRQSELEATPVSVERVLQDAVGLLEYIVPRSVEVVLEVKHDVPVVTADVGALEQVLLNLAANARDAMPDGGTLTLGARKRDWTRDDAAEFGWGTAGPVAVISVTDTGSGMLPEIAERVFEPFFTTKPEGVGTGLGLAMVYGIVDQHGGWVQVDSSVGQGTTVSILLPAAPPPG